MTGMGLATLCSVSGCTTAPPAPPCVLDPAALTAAIVRRDSPLGRLHDAETDVLAVGNRDVVDWQGVEVALTGVVFAADGRRHATGRYVGDASREVPRGGEVAFALREFTNSRGGRWAALTMRATSVEVTLRRAGVSCRGQLVVTGG